MVTENKERDKSIKILTYMLTSFVVCFSSWVVLELLGSLGVLGVNAGIYIGTFLTPSSDVIPFLHVLRICTRTCLNYW